jgi:hypothetical protein
VPDGPADDRFLFLSDVLPTAWQAVQYAQIPAGARPGTNRRDVEDEVDFRLRAEALGDPGIVSD